MILTLFCMSACGFGILVSYLLYIYAEDDGYVDGSLPGERALIICHGESFWGLVLLVFYFLFFMVLVCLCHTQHTR